MFTKLTIENFKSFASETIPLKPFTVLLGPNAAGKSNVFYALLTLRRIAIAPLLPRPKRTDRRGLPDAGESVDGEKRSHTALGSDSEPVFPAGSRDLPLKYTVREGNENLRIRLGADFKREGEQVSYTVSFGRHVQSVSIFEEAFRSDNGVETFAIDTSKEPLSIRKSDGEIRTWPTPRNRSAPYLLNPLQYQYDLGSLPQVAAAIRLQQILSDVGRFRFDPHGIKMAARPGIGVGANGYGLAPALALLRDDKVRFGALESEFRRLFGSDAELSFPQPFAGVLQLGLREKRGTAEYPADCLSDGMLLGLAILWAIFSDGVPNTLCLEEPENGVHPHVIQELVQLLRRASRGELDAPTHQILVSTHSPEFLRWCDPEEVLIVEKDASGTSVRSWPEEFGREQLEDRFRMATCDAWLSGAVGGVPR